MLHQSTPNDLFLRRDCFADIDLQAAQLSGHDQLYRQLGGGKFEGGFTTVEDSNGSGIYIERVNQVIEQAGAVPQGHVSILFLTGGEQQTRLATAFFKPSQFTMAGPGQVLEFQTAKDTEVCVLTMSVADFERRSEGTACQNIAIGGMATFENPGATARLRDQVAEMTSLAFGDGQAALRRGPLPSLSAWMDEAVSAVLDQTHSRDDIQQTEPRSEIFRAARSMILDALDRITVPILSRQLHISRRTLEYVFQERTGVSPLAYIKAAKLDAIRRDIIRTDDTIGDIAARFGVWHMSRLAASYRAAFGHLPSQTRRGFPAARSAVS